MVFTTTSFAIGEVGFFGNMAFLTEVLDTVEDAIEVLDF